MNVLCNGTRLEHLELLRNDSAFLDAVGADSIPDPTTAGDFCRRFSQQDIDALMTAINEVSSVPPEDIVFGCNDRCDQENLIAQLSGGVRSLCAPVDNLQSNWAYMLMTSVACKANDSSLDELERLHTGLG